MKIKSRFIKIIFLFLILFNITLLYGCTHDMSRREIDEINLALVICIDHFEGEYVVNALYSTGGGADPEKGAGSGEEELAEGKGATPYEALEDLKDKNKKAISIAQAGSFLIGQEAAEMGLDRCLDFLSRDETIKMEALIYIIKDRKASDFVKQGIENDQIIHEDLEAIEQKQQEILTRNDNTMVNILNDMKQSLSSTLIPYLIAEESGYVIEGYAVFDELKLSDYLDRETSDGVNFIKNIMRSYPIYLQDQASLMVSYTKTKLKAELRNKKVVVTIKMDFETMMKEVLTKGNIFIPEVLERLTDQQNQYILSIIEKPVNYSINTGRDILGLARVIENQNFNEWESIEGDWSERIAKIEYRYQLKSKISKSFILGTY